MAQSIAPFTATPSGCLPALVSAILAAHFARGFADQKSRRAARDRARGRCPYCHKKRWDCRGC